MVTDNPRPEECNYNKDDIRDFHKSVEVPVVTEHNCDCPYCGETNTVMFGEYEGRMWIEHYCEHLETFRANYENGVEMCFIGCGLKEWQRRGNVED